MGTSIMTTGPKVMKCVFERREIPVSVPALTCMQYGKPRKPRTRARFHAVEGIVITKFHDSWRWSWGWKESLGRTTPIERIGGKDAAAIYAIVVSACSETLSSTGH
jgi:hypothetical protein